MTQVGRSALGPQPIERLNKEGEEVRWQGNRFPIANDGWKYLLLADLSGGPDVPSPIRYFTHWDQGSGSIVANSLGELLHLWNQGYERAPTGAQRTTRLNASTTSLPSTTSPSTDV